MSIYSMTSAQGFGAAAPQGFAADLLGGVNRWQTASSAGRAYAQGLQGDIYNANQNQMNLNRQGTNALIGDIGRSTMLTQGLTGNIDAQRELYMARCVANNNDPNQCRALFDASVGRAPQQTQTQGPQQTMAQGYQPFNINNYLEL